MAAVFPAQPEPMITTSRIEVLNFYFTMWLWTTMAPVSAAAAKLATDALVRHGVSIRGTSARTFTQKGHHRIGDPPEWSRLQLTDLRDDQSLACGKELARTRITHDAQRPNSEAGFFKLD